jgi:hypothetical protein
MNARFAQGFAVTREERPTASAIEHLCIVATPCAWRRAGSRSPRLSGSELDQLEIGAFSQMISYSVEARGWAEVA